MSDGFTPAKVEGDPALAPTPQPLRPVPDNLAADAMLHMAAIAQDVAVAFRHLSDLLPAAAQPLARMANSIETRIEAVRGLMAREPVAGPQQDHS